MTRTVVFVAVAAAAVIASAVVAYQFGVQRGKGMSAPAAEQPAAKAATVDPSAWTLAQGQDATVRHQRDGIKAGDVDPVTGRRVLYYHDPMVPDKQFPAPGKSPFMDMMLVPVYAGGDSADPGHVTISPRIAQNIGLRTVAVTETRMAPQISAVGAIAYNERDQAVVQARAQGYVEKLHVRATLDRVAKGQPLVDLYIPDWVAAQEEFLSVRRMQGRDLGPILEGARQRMRQAGMSDEQIAAVERSGQTQPRTTLHAPIGGVMSEIAAREGMTVMPGATLFRINGLSTVWANAELPESVAAQVSPGMKVTARSPSTPGATLEGRVQTLLPEVNAQTRTVKARIEMSNPGQKLVPGMFVQLDLAAAPSAPVLTVPSEAVIQTGARSVVMLAEESGRYRPVEVQTGREIGGQTEIRRGLAAGQRVVLAGQFLIDSEASLKGLESRLSPDAAPVAPSDPAAHVHAPDPAPAARLPAPEAPPAAHVHAPDSPPPTGHEAHSHGAAK